MHLDVCTWGNGRKNDVHNGFNYDADDIEPSTAVLMITGVSAKSFIFNFYLIYASYESFINSFYF